MTTNPNNTPLTPEEINQAGGAFARFTELRQKTIASPTDEAELRGLVEFLSSFAIDHFSELLGSICVLRNEYQPLIEIFAQVVNRCNAVNGVRAQQRAAAQQQATAEGNEVEKGKIIQLHP